MDQHTVSVEQLHEDLCGDLERIKKRFLPGSGTRLMLVVRNTAMSRADVVIGDADPDECIALIEQYRDGGVDGHIDLGEGGG